MDYYDNINVFLTIIMLIMSSSWGIQIQNIVPL
jgi:hypothetical protein